MKSDVRSGLARLLEAVPQQQGDASVDVWDEAGAVANALLAEPLGKAIAAVVERERERERALGGGLAT